MRERIYNDENIRRDLVLYMPCLTLTYWAYQVHAHLVHYFIMSPARQETLTRRLVAFTQLAPFAMRDEHLHVLFHVWPVQLRRQRYRERQPT